MKRTQLLILATTLISLVLVIPIILISNSNAQVQNDERFFQKDFCRAEINLLNGINYTTNEELSYDGAGCPVSQITIHRWSELSTVSKTLITTRMNTNGYTDITSVIQNEISK